MNVFGDATRPLEGNTQIFHLFGRVQALAVNNNTEFWRHRVPGTKNNKYRFFNRQAKPILKHILVNCVYNFLELLLDLSQTRICFCYISKFPASV